MDIDTFLTCCSYRNHAPNTLVRKKNSDLVKIIVKLMSH